MDLFKYIFRRIIYRLPLKLLLIFVIALLVIVILQTKGYCVSQYVEYDYNDIHYKVWINQDCMYMCRKSDGLPVLRFITNTAQSSYGRLQTDSNGNQYWYSWGSGNYTQPVAYDSSTNAYTGQGNYSGVNSSPWSIPSDYFVLTAGRQVRDYDSNEILFDANELNPDIFPSLIPPFLTDDSQIPTWNFGYLIIHTGTISPFYLDTSDNSYRPRTINLEVTNKETGIVYTINCWDYLDDVNNGYGIIEIPRNVITRFNVRNGMQVAFDLFVQPDDDPNSTGNWSSYSLGTYTLTLSASEQEQINQDTQATQIEEINSGISNLNTSIDDLNNTNKDFYNYVSNDNVSSTTMSDFVNGDGLNVTDNTGIDRFFNILYAYFCTNEPVSVTFTIPFVNKLVTISSDNVSSFFPQSLRNIVSLIAWGGIGLFICKDVRKMINKMNEGNVENVSKDVKKEVL